ncbi:Isopentenyl phosphate kinase [Candidatus Gugararchaeum adminiculabundum]|nr:Isopentenyl phosphate kinase [Candidatus Gugararchaeum adminiculabundum]
MRIVLKLGTALLAKNDGTLDEARIKKLAEQVSSLSKGNDFIIISSGAIGAGFRQLGFKKKPRDIVLLQACAAAGQPLLMGTYSKIFKKQKVAQVLLTADDFSDRKRYLNLRNTIMALLEQKIIPIINENDVVSVREIEGAFGDNDELAALVASAMQADKLLILTTVDGLFTGNPEIEKEAEFIPRVEKIDNKILAMAQGKNTSGRGGMATKINAAKIATTAGVETIIANGKKDGTIAKALAGKCGTLFAISSSGTVTGKKNWIAFSGTPKGTIKVNQGAADAVASGKSLLPVGITSASGGFKRGDVISIENEAGKKIAKAIANYSNSEIEKIKGMHSAEIKKKFGFEYDEAAFSANIAVV